MKTHSIKNLKHYLTNTSWVLSERIFRLVIILFVTMYIARYLGPDKFGLLNYTISLVGFFQFLVHLGLDSIVVMALVKKEYTHGVILGTCFYLKLAGALISVFLLGVIAVFISDSYETTILIAIVACSHIFQAFNNIDLFFQSQVKSKFVVFALSLQVTLSSALKIFLVLVSAPLTYFAFAILAEASILACGLIYFYNYAGPRTKKWMFNKELAVKLLQKSWPLIVTGLTISLYMKIDQVMIKHLLNDHAVGLYSAAVRLSEAWYFIPMVISTSLFPAIIRQKESSSADYINGLIKLYKILVFISVVIAIFTTISADLLIAVIYGPEYETTAVILSVHIWAIVFVSLGVVSGKWIVVESFENYALYRSMVGALTNILLNTLLIPEYGTIGAAVATLTSFAISGYLFDIVLPSTRISFIMKSKALIFYPNRTN